MSLAIKEKDIQKAIIDYLSYTGWYVLRMPPSIYSSFKGIPDLYAVKKGVSIWIECKSPKGRLSKKQQEVIDSLKGHGAIVFVFNNIDIALRELNRLNKRVTK